MLFFTPENRKFWRYRKEKWDELEALVERLVEGSRIWWSEGVLALGAIWLPKLEDKWERRSFQLMIDGTDEKLLSQLLYNYVVAEGKTGAALLKQMMFAEWLLNDWEPDVARYRLLIMLVDDGRRELENEYQEMHPVLTLTNRKLWQCSRREKVALLPVVEWLAEVAETRRRAEWEKGYNNTVWLRGKVNEITDEWTRDSLRVLATDADDEELKKKLYHRVMMDGQTGAVLLKRLMLIEGLLAIHDGMNPRIVEEIGMSMMEMKMTEVGRKLRREERARRILAGEED